MLRAGSAVIGAVGKPPPISRASSIPQLGVAGCVGESGNASKDHRRAPVRASKARTGLRLGGAPPAASDAPTMIRSAWTVTGEVTKY